MLYAMVQPSEVWNVPKAASCCMNLLTFRQRGKAWNRAFFPSLHHRKEGWLRHQENFAQPPKLTQPGWFSFCSHRKTTPASRSAEASQYFFDRSATPPCGDARRGIALFQFLHTSQTAPTATFAPAHSLSIRI